jgi:hypothetical protein
MPFFRKPALLTAALVLLVPLVSPLAVFAQDAGPGVARVAYLQGEVAIQRGDGSGPTGAVVNAPVEPADYVTTGNNSRAEVQFDGGSSVRLGSDVQMRFVHIDPQNREMQLAQGTIDLRAIRGRDLNDTIDTPSISVRPNALGSTRVTVGSDGVTRVVVRSGSANVITPSGTQTLGVGQTLIAQGPASNPSISTSGAPAYDSFDTFDNSRDQYEESPGIAASAPYVNQDIVGVDDLGPYGSWTDDPTYGEVWVPADQNDNWAPYQDGQWVWEPGYGWTWVASEPWGWAPYHYGSWYHRHHGGWAWYPPRPGGDPMWQPALVAFVGFGGGIGVSLDFGDPNFDLGLNIGWIPLAPFEPYYPWWNSGGGYTNIAYVNSYNAYQNYGYASYVSGHRFFGGRFGHASRVSAGMYRQAHVFQGATPFVPTAANARYSNRAVPSALAVRRAPFARTYAGHPAVAAPQSFAAQRAAVARVSHAPVRAVSAQTVTTRTAAARSAAYRSGAVHMAARPAPQRAPATANRAAPGRAPVTANRGAAPRTATALHNAPRPAVANHGAPARTHVPAAFAREFPAKTHAAPAAVSHAAPARTHAMPTVVSHAAPAARSHAAPVRMVAPARNYTAPRPAAPARTYAAPRPAAAPARTYVAPRPAAAARPAYVAPARPAYVAPARPAYVAPARPAYVAPARPAYVAPARPAYVAPARPAYVAPRAYAAPRAAPAAPARPAPRPPATKQVPPPR